MSGSDLFAALPAAAICEGLLRWVDGLAGRLIQCAARSAPASLSARLQEEWLADLAARRGPASRLRLALGCCWAASVIMREHALAGVAAAGAAGGHHTRAGAYPANDSPFLPRRTIALLLIACLHVALIYFLAIGLAHKFAPEPPPLMSASVMNERQPHALPPPPPPPTLTPARVEIPDPDVRLDVPADTSSIQSAPLEQPDEHSAQPPAPKVSDRILGGPGKGFPNTADYYPDASRRLGEQGVATVRVCVDGNGRLTANPVIQQSSGTARLDSGALTLAKAGSGHYRATTDDGRAVNSCFPFRIRFEFRN